MAGVERQRFPGERAGDWMRDEWSTVAGGAHGLAAAPGVILREREEAIEKSRRVAGQIDRIARDPEMSGYDRDRNVAKLQGDAGRDPRVRSAAEVISRSDPQAPLTAEARAKLGGYAHSLLDSAEAMEHHGSDGVSRLSRTIGSSVEAVAGKHGGALLHNPIARAVPFAGALMTAGATADDIANKHIPPGAAIAGNVGGSIVGTAAGVAAEATIAAAVGGGALVAAPLVAVVGGVIVATAVGYGVTHYIEEKASRK